MNLKIAKAALAITQAKADEILNPKPEHQNKFSKAVKFINDKTELLKEKAMGANIDIYESKEATMALNDVTLLLAYLCKNYNVIISKEEA